ncbi:MAG: hypothetical protein MRZ79_20970 [Bacteroidia bacterium]|nr:hypothetical protein [Bacteroidia bacterium]
MRLQQYILDAKPKTLFLIDALGALLSAVLLGVVLVEFQSYIGMPKEILYRLAFLAGIFAAYSFFCYARIKARWPIFLRIIAITNILYSILTMGLVFYLHNDMTLLGYLYFILEVIIVVTLALAELYKANSKQG